MIFSGRPGRHIGPQSLVELLREAVLAPLLIVVAGAVAATLILLIKLAFGGALWPQMLVWPLTFTVLSGFPAASLLLGRRWIEATVAIGLIVLVFFLAKSLATPIFSAIMGYEGTVIVPVNP